MGSNSKSIFLVPSVLWPIKKVKKNVLELDCFWNDEKLIVKKKRQAKIDVYLLSQLQPAARI